MEINNKPIVVLQKYRLSKHGSIREDVTTYSSLESYEKQKELRGSDDLGIVSEEIIEA